MTYLAKKPHIPTDEEAILAEEGVRALSGLELTSDRAELTVHGRRGNVDISVPPVVLEMLSYILTQLAQGNSVTLTPHHAELTTQQAADFLNVSRPYVIKLLDQGKIPFRKVGRHRRILFAELVAYKEENDAARSRVLDELTAKSEELGIGY